MIGGVVIAALVVSGGLSGCDAPGRQDGMVVEPAPAAAVSSELAAALAEALDDERHAIAFYEAVMARHGTRRPFSNIVHAERRHAAAVLAQYERFGLDVPEDRWRDTAIEVPATFRESCRASVEAEIRNVAIYDRIIAVATDPATGDPEVAKVFERLRWASQERHLPAFRRCSGG